MMSIQSCAREWPQKRTVQWYSLPTGGMCVFVDKRSGSVFELEVVDDGKKFKWLWNSEGQPLKYVDPALA